MHIICIGVIFLNRVSNCGRNEFLNYEIVLPMINNEYICTYLDELCEDIKFYIENDFGNRLFEMLRKHKKGSVYCDFHITSNTDSALSVVVLLGGFDGAELVHFEYYTITLDSNGNILPSKCFCKSRKNKKRQFFINDEKTVCFLDDNVGIVPIKIRKNALFQLLKVIEVQPIGS